MNSMEQQQESKQPNAQQPHSMAPVGSDEQRDEPHAKHKWVFVKNTSTAKASFGPRGSTMHVSLRGLYKCACGAERIGKANMNAPGNDLRQFLGMGQS